MARETKVGLLAGLAFIICFAVILANRGSNAPPGLANTFLPKGGLELPKLVQRQQGNAADANVRKRGQTALRPNQESLSANNSAPVPGLESPRSAAEQVPPSGSQLPLAVDSNPTTPPAHSLADNTRPVEVATDIHASLQDALRSKPLVDVVPRTDASMSMTATSPNSAQPLVSPPAIADTPSVQTASTTPARDATPHTVKPSETLSSIASTHYGTKSGKAVDAIFEANRDVLKDPDHLRSGMVLMIPRLAGSDEEKTQTAGNSLPAAKQAEKHAEAKSRPTEKGASSKNVEDRKPVRKVSDKPVESEKAAQSFKWYQVKKNDRFASIAREQLGDAGRWQEVYELNKDKFPDPQKIREGVRIKLPTTALAEAGKEKRR